MTDDADDESPLPPEFMSGLGRDVLPHERVERAVVHRLHEARVLSRRARPTHRGSTILVGAIAAGIVFMAGMRTGSSRSASIAAPTDSSVMAAAGRYADALARVDTTQDSSRIAALASLRVVTAQLDRLAPDNAVVSLAAGLLEGSVIRGPLVSEPVDSTRSYVVWH